MECNLVEVLEKDIKLNYKTIDLDINIIKIQYFKKSNVLKLVLKSKQNISNETKKDIKDIIKKRFNCFNDIELCFYKDISNVSFEEVCEKYWNEICGEIIPIVPSCKTFLLRVKKQIKDNNLYLFFNNEFIFQMMKKKQLNKLIDRNVKDLFGISCKTVLKIEEDYLEKDYFKQKDKEEDKIIKNIILNPSHNLAINDKVNNKVNKNNRKSIKNDNFSTNNVIMGRNINDDIIEIKDINEISGIVAIEGEVFKTKIIETKTGRKIVCFYITDYTSSITVKCFPKSKDEDKVIENIKEGFCCKVRGEAAHDNYSNEVVIMGRDIVKASKKQRMDAHTEKRIELHAHTQMSAMDAIVSATQLIEKASNWGHNAIAITDHGVAQSFPEAMEACKKYNLKVIYGVEAYLVDDGVPIVYNEKNKTINDSFVVFDIETTGFSSENDKIIEIGAVKIEKGKIIASFNKFVNPEISIPFKIKELTGINDEMVKNAETIENVLPNFLKFIGDAIVVAHNASFDISFIKKNCKDLNIKFNNAIMDTIPLCKYIFPELKKYKLNTICKHIGISLENHHRAVDDAKATGEILIYCFKILQEKEIIKLEELNKKYLGNQDVKKAPTYHLIILVKNQIGLKNLYKLISISHLEYFHRRPRMPKSLIEKHREGLIIGSACEAGQLYREVLQNKDETQLEEIINFYDYLEIQPVGNNMFMIRNGNVKDVEELRKINKTIYELGRKYNKPVIATGDVHFLEPRDEVYRRILMNGQGYSDADNQPPLYFKTTDEMLEEFQYLGSEQAKEVVIHNPQKIASLVENVKPIPDETFPPKIEGSEEQIRQMAIKKAHKIYGDKLPKLVNDRLEKELNSIISNGYAVLYLIAQKLVAKSLQDGYLVGSRGSVGSSFVATMCDITEVNGLPPHYICPKCKYSEFFTDGSIGSGFDLPDKNCPKCGTELNKDGHDIPFETFLGFNGDKEPDIDLNFSGDNQGDIHKYTEVLFGKGHTFKAGTIGTIAEKTAYGFVKKYLEEKGIVVSKAEMERLASGCTGVKRTSGQHPGGIMVVPQDNEIFNFCPIQHPADDPDSEIITTHFDYHSISGRLLKLDILGHDDPTVLRMLKDLTGVDPRKVPLGDTKVMSLFTSPEALGITKEELGCEVGTYGLPEFGTKFVRQMLVETKPKSFSDLVRISGLSHGTDVWINNAQYFIKEGYTTIKNCIATRDDIMMYLLHKKLEPKDAFTIMEKVRKGKGLSEEHESIMRAHEVPDWYIQSCKKIKYMFPKGHAAAYVMMAVRIAYFKVYYPKAYYTTYFSVRADEFDADIILEGEEAIKMKMEELNSMGNKMTVKDKNLLTILEMSYEMYKRGIKFLKVDLYKSNATRFLIEEEGIRIPINALSGIGANAAKNIVLASKESPFISKEDLRIRGKVSKTVIETLTNHGCLDGLPETNQLSLFNL